MKKIFLITLIVLVIAALICLSIFLIHKYRNKKQDTADVSSTISENENSLDSANTTTSAIERDLYFSNSDIFENYFFKVPKEWLIYEKDNGERVVLNNRNKTETIVINIVNIEKADSLSDFVTFKEKYFEGLKDFSDTAEFDMQNIKISGMNSVILGYEYESKLEEKQQLTDLISYFKNDNFLYTFKYIGKNIEIEKAGKFFSDFLENFNLNKQNNLKGRKTEKSKSLNLLILGDDSAYDRPGGRVNGRADIIMILHINPESGDGTIITIPRDTWVKIPGHGEGKINGAHAIGGNDLMVKTVEEFSGLEIDNYIITDFDGFIPLIDFFGGVTVEVNEDLSDGFSGCYLSKGTHHLNGEQALALARNRHRNGEPGQQGGAYAREREAAKMIIALMRQQSNFERFIKMPFFINYLLNYVWTDIEFKDIAKYLLVFDKINYSKIDITTIPSWPEMVGNASAVVYDKQATQELFESLDEH